MSEESTTPDWVRDCLRRADVSDWRPGGRRHLLGEPVLLCLGSWFPREVYDQGGHLLAEGQPAQSRSGLARVIPGLAPVDLFDVHGDLQFFLSTNKGWDRELFAATAADGREIGTVVLKGEQRGRILIAGTPAGQIRDATASRWGFKTGYRRDDFTVYDANDNRVGRVAQLDSKAQTPLVIEIEQSASETFRALMLIVGAAIRYRGELEGPVPLPRDKH
jgi:hypothetical protein